MENLMIICTSITTNHSVGELIMVTIGTVVIGGIVASLMILTMEILTSLIKETAKIAWCYFRDDFAWDVVEKREYVHLWYVRNLRLPLCRLKRQIRKKG